MTYTVVAKRFTPDGMTADKRVHTECTHEEAVKLMRRYSPKATNYWADVRMKLEPSYADVPDHLIQKFFDELMDGSGEGQ